MSEDQRIAWSVCERADAAWSAEGRRCFGRNWGYARYDERGKGALGSVLRQLHDEYVKARDEAHSLSARAEG